MLDRKIAEFTGTPAMSPGIALNDSRMQAEQMQQQMQGMPPQMAAAGGLIGLPSPNMARMAGGGIVGFQDGGMAQSKNPRLNAYEKLFWKNFEMSLPPEGLPDSLDSLVSPQAQALVRAAHEKTKQELGMDSQQSRQLDSEEVRGRTMPADVQGLLDSMKPRDGMAGGGIVAFQKGGDVDAAKEYIRLSEKLKDPNISRTGYKYDAGRYETPSTG